MSIQHNATINPLCAVCNLPIGDMPLDIYIRAVEYRGDHLLCPDCRAHQCDCCGWFLPGQETRKVVDWQGYFAGNACDVCFDWVLPDNPNRDDFPAFQLCQKPNLMFVTYTMVDGKKIYSIKTSDNYNSDEPEPADRYESNPHWEEQKLRAL